MNGRPKVKVQQHIKVHNVMNVFPAEFGKTPMNELLYKLCECVAPCSKKFFVDSHTQTVLSETKRQPKFPQSFLTGFSTKVIEAFLSADIPLYKLNNPKLKV